MRRSSLAISLACFNSGRKLQPLAQVDTELERALQHALEEPQRYQVPRREMMAVKLMIALEYVIILAVIVAAIIFARYPQQKAGQVLPLTKKAPPSPSPSPSPSPKPNPCRCAATASAPH